VLCYDSGKSRAYYALVEFSSAVLWFIIRILLCSCLEQVGAILGRAGCVVKEIMSLSGTQIQVRNRDTVCSLRFDIQSSCMRLFSPTFLSCFIPPFFPSPLCASQISQKDQSQGSGDKFRQVKVVGLQNQVRSPSVSMKGFLMIFIHDEHYFKCSISNTNL
jgi:hypothetical protein